MTEPKESVSLRNRFRFRKQIRELDRLVDREALQIAERVRAGEFTRADVEGWVRQYGDGEPIRALEILDSWGIK